MIEVDQLEVVFDRNGEPFRAVQEARFTVPEGSSFGLVGESGSGKSTVLRAIGGLIDDWRGTVRLAGRPVGQKRTPDERKLVQMVFQDPYGSLHPRHTVDDILREPCVIHRVDDIDRRVGRMLAAVGLGPGFRYRFPHQLSGGQRQRVAIARALILEPRIVLLDEPTSALDVSVQAEVLNLLSDLRRDRGLTYLFVSHNLAVVAQMCDRLAIMTQGRIVEEAATSALATGELEDPYSRELLASSEGYLTAPA
ncbi:MAG: ABC transporter ATP-binding protein [Geminicoccaceae bacterium]